MVCLLVEEEEVLFSFLLPFPAVDQSVVAEVLSRYSMFVSAVPVQRTCKRYLAKHCHSHQQTLSRWNDSS